LVAKVTGKSFGFESVSMDAFHEGLVAAGLPPFVVDAALSIQHMWSPIRREKIKLKSQLKAAA
jgi:hypothetical protein